MTHSPLLATPLRQLARELEAGILTGEALVAASIEAYESGGNSAYLSWQPQRALEFARAGDKVRAAGGNAGPLMGIPVSVKDMFGVPGFPRSEEHTSELQSRPHLVCRLLL